MKILTGDLVARWDIRIFMKVIRLQDYYLRLEIFRMDVFILTICHYKVCIFVLNHVFISLFHLSLSFFLLGNRPITTSTPLCKNFLKNVTCYGPCKFTHKKPSKEEICQNFLEKQNCEKANCNFMHCVWPRGSNEEEQNRLKKIKELSDHIPSDKKNHICRNFLHDGNCYRQCKFVHGFPPKPQEPPKKAAKSTVEPPQNASKSTVKSPENSAKSTVEPTSSSNQRAQSPIVKLKTEREEVDSNDQPVVTKEKENEKKVAFSDRSIETNQSFQGSNVIFDFFDFLLFTSWTLF